MTTSRSLTRRELLQAGAAVAAAGLASPLLAAEPARYQLGCYTRPWAKFDYRVALDGIAAAGYKFAGLMTTTVGGKARQVITNELSHDEVAAIADEVKKRGLKVLSIYGGGFPVAKSVEAGMGGLKTLIDHSATCGCPNLLLGGTTDKKLFSDYYKVVTECCDYAASKGVGLSVKPHGGQNATGAECRKIIDLVGKPNFRIWYDAGNIYYYSKGALDPVQDAPSVHGLVAGMSIKDFLPPQNVDVTPGTGQVKFREVMAKLQQGGFTSGPLVVECLTPAAEPPQIIAEAKKARQFLVELVGADRAE